jgi:hypothetical protein
LPRKGLGKQFLGPEEEVPVSPLLGTEKALSILGFSLKVLLHKNCLWIDWLLNRKQCRLVTGLLTNSCTLRQHLHVMGL